MNKIVVNRNDFLRALASTSSIINKPMIPILENVKCMVKGNIMRVVSNNGELAMSQVCAIVESSEDIKFCINPKEIISYIKLLNDDEIELNVNVNKFICDVKHGRGSTRLAILSADDFPIPSVEDKKDSFSLPSNILYDILSISYPFLGADKLKPLMSCVFVRVEPSGVTYCASDAHILISDKINMELPIEDSFQTLIHASAFRPLMDILKLSDKINVFLSQNQAMFSNDFASLSCTLVEGNYPKFESIIPKNFKIHVENVSVDALKMSVERCKLANDNVLFNFGKNNNIHLKAVGLQSGHTNEEDIVCNCEDELDIAFKSENILNCLSGIIDVNKCTLLLNDPTHPMVMKDEKIEKNVLIMPVRFAN